MPPQVLFEKIGQNRFMIPQIQRELFIRAPKVTTVVRFLGPSKFSSLAYETKVYSMLEQIKMGLNSIQEKVGISTGVSGIGLDAMLSKCFFGSFSTTGVVSWMMMKIMLELEDSSKVVFEDKDYNTKFENVSKMFGGLNSFPALLVEGNMPEDEIEIDNPGLKYGELVVKKIRFAPDSTPFSKLDRFAVFGADWGQAYEMFRPGLSAVVVLGGGPISEQEAITAYTLGIPVYCIDPDILGEPHRPADPAKNKPEVLSASVKLVKERGFRPYNVDEIIEEIL